MKNIKFRNAATSTCNKNSSTRGVQSGIPGLYVLFNCYAKFFVWLINNIQYFLDRCYKRRYIYPGN